MLLNAFKYFFWCLFFVLQGKSIQQCIEKNMIFRELIYTLVGFFLAKCLVMIADILKQFVTDSITNQEMAKQWDRHFPETLFRDNADEGKALCLLYFDYLPSAFRLETSIINNHYTLVIITMILVLFLILSKFFLGLFIAVALFSFTFISKNFFLRRLSNHYSEVAEKKNQIFQWILQYVEAWREVSLCWQRGLTRWTKEQYQSVYRTNQQLIQTQFYRDITTQCLVELPFILNTCAMVIGIYFNYLSVTAFFVWVGCSQFIILAANAYTEKKTNIEQQKVIFRKIEGVLKQFNLTDLTSVRYLKDLTHKNLVDCNQIEEITKEEITKADANNNVISRSILIKLMDGTETILSLSPGIYHIQGENGAGKTTLLNAVMGYERSIKVNDYDSLRSFLGRVNRENLRFVEREPILFDLLMSFSQQILGPQEKCFQLPWQQIFQENMKQYLTSEEIKRLLAYFNRLEAKFYLRQHQTFSSGEKVLISLMRVLLSWNNQVTVLLVDECTAFLDQLTKILFMEVIKQLSQHVAIFFIAHEHNHLGIDS